MTEDEKRPDAEQLLLAGVIAPVVRKGAERARQRRFQLVDREGRVVGETTLLDVQKGILDAANLQFDIEGRPERRLCTRCRKVLKIPKKGKVRKQCDPCRVRSKHEHDSSEMRWKFFSKMIAIARTGKIPEWLPMQQYKQRYGERPPVEWLERLGLR